MKPEPLKGKTDNWKYKSVQYGHKERIEDVRSAVESFAQWYENFVIEKDRAPNIEEAHLRLDIDFEDVMKDEKEKSKRL